MVDRATFDAFVRHSVYIERYKARVAREIVEIVAALGVDLFDLVSRSDLQSMTRRNLDAMLAEVNRMTKAAYAPAIEEIEAHLRDFASSEAAWQARAFDLGVPSDADLWASVKSRPFNGKLLRDWLSDLPAGTSKRVRGVIRQGYVEGLGSAEVARQIRGTRSRQGIMDTSKRGAEAMVRTAIAHTAGRARAVTYEQNPTIRFEQWVSVLDHRTTPVCRGRDGTLYPKGKGPRPPAHIGCRSTTIPVTSRSKVAAETRGTYSDWLKRQPKHVQDDILGEARAKLWRDGGLTLDRFIDKSGQEYTLAELKARDAEAWAEAFGE
jgi:SPP1 gp7 family putative phage head morphogenesis protein